MKICLFVVFAGLASGLLMPLKPDEEKQAALQRGAKWYGQNNAYLMMWVTRKYVPKDVNLFENVLTKEEELAVFKELKKESMLDADAPIPRMPKLRQSVVEEQVEELDRFNADEEYKGQEFFNVSHGGGAKAILAQAKNLQKVGAKYPLVILTNEPQLLAIKTDPTLRAEYPNVQVREIKDNEWLKHECKMSPDHWTHYQKLSIFGLTEYDRILWLDADIGVKQNMDSVFKFNVKDGDQVWGQKDDYTCQQSRGFCSGIMLFKPKAEHLEGLKQQARMMKHTCWGDQNIISKYFRKEGRNTALFQHNVVRWRHCSGPSTMATHNQLPPGQHPFGSR